MADFESNAPPPHRVTEGGTRGSQSVEADDEMPLVKRLDGDITRQGVLAFVGGPHCETWIGQLKRCNQGEGGREEVYEKVALKVVHATRVTETVLKGLKRELSGWAELSHGNILPLYGVVTRPQLYMVSPWMEKGNLLTYVKNTPEADKNYLLCGSAAGLNYLHSLGMVHGSVNCNNILISQEGEPQICDFGIAKIVGDNAAGHKRRPGNEDLIRYSALELIEHGAVAATTKSDTLSFGMVMLGCITEEFPFPEISRAAQIVHLRINRRENPRRPGGQDPRKRVDSDDLWNLMTRCWSYEPDHRPSMAEVHNYFLAHV